MINDEATSKESSCVSTTVPISTILSDEQLRELFDGVNDLIQSVTPDGRFLFVNRAWRELLGYTAEDLAALTIFSIIHPDHHAECLESIQRIIGGEDLGLIEVPFLTKDGRVVIVEGNVSLYSINDIPIATRGIFRNITERKTAENEIRTLNETLERTVAQRTLELRMSEKRFRDFIASIPGAVYEFCIDAHGCRSLPFMSEGIADLIGISAIDCMADVGVIFKQIHPEAIPELDASIFQSMENLLPWSHEYPVMTPDGEKWLRGYSIPRRENDGSTRWRGVLVDITRQKHMEMALRNNEQLFRSLTEVAPVGIFRTDETGKCLYVNERWCLIAGMDAETALGFGWVTAIYPEDRERVMNEWSRAVQYRRQFISEYRFQTKEKVITWILGHAQAERDQSGNVLGYVGTITNITDQKMKENELAESRHLLKTIIDTAPVRIFWKDRNSRYLGCNPIFARDAGVASLQEIIGKTDYELSWTEEQADHYRADDRQVIDSGVPKLYYEESVNNAAGESLWIEVT